MEGAVSHFYRTPVFAENNAAAGYSFARVLTLSAALPVQIAIEPKSKGDRDKMSTGLIKLSQEDPSFHFFRNEETNQTVIEGIGELHLESLVDRLKGEFKVRGPGRQDALQGQSAGLSNQHCSDGLKRRKRRPIELRSTLRNGTDGSGEEGLCRTSLPEVRPIFSKLSDCFCNEALYMQKPRGFTSRIPDHLIPWQSTLLRTVLCL